MNTNTQRLFYSTACPTIVNRAGWGARPPRGTPAALPRPVPTVIIHHGGTQSFCTNQTRCAELVRAYQNHHMDTNGWLDIGYHFVVGEDGRVYEGRGWTRQGAHAGGCNARSIGIAFIGDFTSKSICTVYQHDTY